MPTAAASRYLEPRPLVAKVATLVLIHKQIRAGRRQRNGGEARVPARQIIEWGEATAAGPSSRQADRTGRATQRRTEKRARQEAW